MKPNHSFDVHSCAYPHSLQQRGAYNHLKRQLVLRHAGRTERAGPPRTYSQFTTELLSYTSCNQLRHLDSGQRKRGISATRVYLELHSPQIQLLSERLSYVPATDPTDLLLPSDTYTNLLRVWNLEKIEPYNETLKADTQALQVLRTHLQAFDGRERPTLKCWNGGSDSK